MDSHLKRCRCSTYVLGVKKTAVASSFAGSLFSASLGREAEKRDWERGCSCGTSCVVQPQHVHSRDYCGTLEGIEPKIIC